jgi:hypothetical protein
MEPRILDPARTEALACTACAEFLDCGHLDKAAAAVAAQAERSVTEAQLPVGDCGYLIRHLGSLPLEAHRAAARERLGRYERIVAELWAALVRLEPGAEKARGGRLPLDFMAQVVAHPTTEARRAFRERYGPVVTAVQRRVARLYERVLEERLAAWDV